MDKTENVATVSGKNEINNRSQEESNNNVKKIPVRFSIKQKLTLVFLAAAEFISFCLMSLMAPFYPREAAAKGMSESMAGFVFGFYALVIFLTSPVFGKILPRIGYKYLFTLGVMATGICSLLFGTLHLIDNYYLFTIFSFVIRGLEALGTSAYSTACYVAIVNVFPSNFGTVRGLLETFVGLGLSVGPAIGGFLYTIGGFGLPFYLVGSVTILLAPFSLSLFPASHKCAIESKSGSFMNLLTLTPVTVTCLIIVNISMTWSFIDPILEPHLRKFQLSPGNIGLIFLLLSAMYGIFSPVWGWATDKISRYWWLMVLGLFLNSVSLILLGSSIVLHVLEDTLWLNIAGLSTLGISVAMSLMPTFPAISDSALAGGFSDTLGTQSLIGGLWFSVYSLGEVIGPILGGSLFDNYGFSVTSTVFSILNFLSALLVTVYICMRKTPSTNAKDKQKFSCENYNKKNSEF